MADDVRNRFRERLTDGPKAASCFSTAGKPASTKDGGRARVRSSK